MRNRLGYAILVTLLGASGLVAACDDDADRTDASGGDSAGGEPSSGGSSAGKAGSTNGGKPQGGTSQGGKAGMSPGGTAGTAQGGAVDGGAGGMMAAGAGGEISIGGFPDPPAGGANLGGAATDGGAGAGGAGEPALEYACTANSITYKLCSAFAAANCANGVDCSDCSMTWQSERDLYADCAVCLAEYDKILQCGIDAYESGNLSAGVECFQDSGDLTANCYDLFQSASQCHEYTLQNGCPASWPVVP